MTQHEYPWKAGPWKFKYILYICCHQVISNQIVSNISWTVFDVWNASVANTKSVNESATSEFEANIESYSLTSNAIISSISRKKISCSVQCKNALTSSKNMCSCHLRPLTSPSKWSMRDKTSFPIGDEMIKYSSKVLFQYLIIGYKKYLHNPRRLIYSPIFTDDNTFQLTKAVCAGIGAGFRAVVS